MSVRSVVAKLVISAMISLGCVVGSVASVDPGPVVLGAEPSYSNAADNDRLTRSTEQSEAQTVSPDWATLALLGFGFVGLVVARRRAR